MSELFDPLQGVIVNPDGTPSVAMQVYWQKFTEALTAALGDIEGQVASIAAAQAAAEAAGTAAAAAQGDVDQIVSGDLPLEAVNVGGTRFVESGGSLVPEP